MYVCIFLALQIAIWHVRQHVMVCEMKLVFIIVINYPDYKQTAYPNVRDAITAACLENKSYEVLFWYCY